MKKIYNKPEITFESFQMKIHNENEKENKNIDEINCNTTNNDMRGEYNLVFPKKDSDAHTLQDNTLV